MSEFKKKLDFWKKKETESKSVSNVSPLNSNKPNLNKGRKMSSNIKKMTEDYNKEIKEANETKASSIKVEKFDNTVGSKVLEAIKKQPKEKQDYFKKKSEPIRKKINDLAKREAEEIRELQKNSINLELSEYQKKEKEIRDKYTKENEPNIKEFKEVVYEEFGAIFNDEEVKKSVEELDKTARVVEGSSYEEKFANIVKKGINEKHQSNQLKKLKGNFIKELKEKQEQKKGKNFQEQIKTSREEPNSQLVALKY